MTIKNLTVEPDDNDLVADLDDQLRSLKKEIKNTFPNLDAPVDLEVKDFDYLDSYISNVEADIDQILNDIDAALTKAGAIHTKKANEFDALAKLPRGLILPYTGDQSHIGRGFVPCDGQNGTLMLDTTGTPFSAFIMCKGA